jgi:cytochrome c oxidase subunit 2
MNMPDVNTLLLSTTSTMGPVERLWFGEQASTFAPKSDALFMFIFWVSTFFFVLIVGLMTYFVFKYRRIPGVPQERSAAHNTPLELSWTFLPMLLLAVMFVWGFRDYMYMHVSPAGAEEIQLKGRQWAWQATYDNGASPTQTTVVADMEVPIIPVPHGRPIRVLLDSEDVIHSFWVPDFRVKIDVMPYRYTSIWFEATGELETHIGPDGTEVQYKDHYLFCTEYCGDQHSQMAAIIRAMPPSDYEAAKADMANIWGTEENPVPLAEVGQILASQNACFSCHSNDGSPGTGPTWLGLYGTQERVRVDGAMQEITVDENYIRESIYEPAAKLVDGYPNQMVSYQGQIDDRELGAIIAYIKSLNPGANGDAQ